jgi:hypothetical protein
MSSFCPVCLSELENDTINIGSGGSIKRTDVTKWELTIPGKGSVRVCGRCFIQTGILDELKKLNNYLRRNDQCLT